MVTTMDIYEYEGPYQRVLRHGRIEYYGAHADQSYWDEHWEHRLTRDMYDAWASQNAGWLEPLLEYLPREGHIVEAGCGVGQYVAVLRARGYDCEGVEWAPRTVELVHRIAPELPVRVGDATALDVRDGYYSAYLSFGVMEHLREGPEPFLAEAHRVLCAGGVALISVPHLHWLRWICGHAGKYVLRADDLPFYQHAFTCGDMRKHIHDAGLTVIAASTYDWQKGLVDELPGLQQPLSRLLQHRRIGPKLDRCLRRCRLGHMALFVCKK